MLIDECLNWRICHALTGHYCASVRKVDWGGLTNGVLLKNAEEEFDVFITADSSQLSAERANFQDRGHRTSRGKYSTTSHDVANAEGFLSLGHFETW